MFQLRSIYCVDRSGYFSVGFLNVLDIVNAFERVPIGLWQRNLEFGVVYGHMLEGPST